MKERKRMFRVSKRQSRILAGLMALVLVFSNIAANVQTVYAASLGGAFPIQRDEDGNVTGIGSYESGQDDFDEEEFDEWAEDESEEEELPFDFHVDIWPEMEKPEEEENADVENEDAEDEAADDEAGTVWTGKWQQYEYVSSGDSGDESWTLGQALLLSDKYKAQYGELDPNLPGTWSGDNDDVMEVRADGTAFVKDEGYVNVTFVYEPEEEEETDEEDAADEEKASDEEDAADEEKASDEEDAADEEKASDEEDAADEEKASDEEDVADEEKAPGEEDVADEEKASDEEDAADEEKASDEADKSAASQNAEDAEEDSSDMNANTEEGNGSEEIAGDESTPNEVISGEKKDTTVEEAEAKESEKEKSTTIENIASDEISSEEIDSENELASMRKTKVATDGNAEWNDDAEDPVEPSDVVEATKPSKKDEATDPAETDESVEESSEEEEEKKNECPLKAGDELTWVVQVKYIGPELMANAPGLTFEGKNGSELKYDGTNHKATITGSGKLTVSGTFNGKIVIEKGRVDIVGEGKIDALNAAGDNRSAITIEGGTTTLNGNITITGGEGTVATGDAAALEPRGEIRIGGGVYVEKGTFNLVNGTISENTAQRGGGIFVSSGQNFVMEGGTVSENQTVSTGGKYAGEGGGIFVWGTATISGGSITDNTCNSQNDLGGGGLYVNNGGIATLINARITGNTADGFGGGIAGCCHGEMSIVAIDGAALYGNTAKGINHTEARYNTDASRNTAEVIDGYKKATSAGITGANSEDFYTAGSCIVSNYMAGGGSAKYTVTSPTDKGVTLRDDEVKKYTQTVVALKANPDQESINKVESGVEISGNHSTVHGGGIGCNGGLYFGSKKSQTIELKVLNLELEAKKRLDEKAPGENKYTFALSYSDDENGWANPIATATNDASGKIKFSLSDYWNDSIANRVHDKKITFYLKEIADNQNSDVTYDQSVYKLNVTLDEEITTEQTVTLGHTTTSNRFEEITVTYKKHIYKEKSKTIEKVRDWYGNAISGSGEPVSGDITFENYTKKVTFTPVVKKEISSDAGLIAPIREYTFNIASEGGWPLPNPATATVKGQGTAVFGEITYYQTGTYTYQITENDPKDTINEAITKDDSIITLVVTVSENASGELVASGVYTGGKEQDKPDTFINTFAPVTTYAPQVKKVFAGERIENSKTFTFKLEQNLAKGNEYDPKNNVVMPENTAVEVTGVQQGPKSFDDITFKKPGTYYFTITEDSTNPVDGYTYDTAPRELKVEVTYNETEGKLVPTATYTCNGETVTDATFTNTYTSEDTTYAPNVRKVVTGDEVPKRTWQTFTFELSADEGNLEGAKLPDNRTLTITDNGTAEGVSASFEAITFEQSGVYTFKITEKRDVSIPGYSYDGNDWTVTVDVGDGDSKLYIRNVTYKRDNGDSVEGEDKEARFENTYDVQDALYAPRVKKIITGDDRTNDEYKKTFTFNLTAEKKNPEGAVLPQNTTVTVTDAGSAAFAPITFTKAGIYVFTIDEEKHSEKGYTYDDTIWTLQVIVRDKEVTDENGNKIRQLVADCDYTAQGYPSSKEEATFTNQYKVEPVDYAPKVEKAVSAENGKSPNLNTQEFTFKLSGDSQDGAELPNEATESTVTVTGTNTKTFGKIHFTKAGSYHFTIEELSDETKNYPGYVYDDNKWTLDVEVKDIDGKLTVTNVTYVQTGEGAEGRSEGKSEEEIVSAKATFTNDYNVEPTHFQPEVEKLFTGNSDPRPQDYIKTFSFTLAGEQDGVTLPADCTAEVTSENVSKNGEMPNRAMFDAIEFTKAGTYTFTITEDDLNENGYLGYGHDDSEWTLTVVVEDVDSKLEVKSHTYTKAGLVIPSIYATFTNSYHAQPTTYQPKVTKQVVGEVIPDRKYFQFTLEAAESNPEGVKWDEHVENGVDSIGVYGLPDYQISQGNFYPVTFEKAGLYMFTILEEDTNEMGYTYDSRFWTLEVVVEDRDGQLEVKSAIYYVTDESGRITSYPDVEDFNKVGDGATARFVNEYKPAPTHYAPEVMKLIYGNAMPPEDRTYTFVLEHGFWYPNGVLTDAGAVMPEDPTATVVGVGRGKFNEIEFTKAGTYNFTVREKDEGGVNGYLYDDTTWNVEVTVIDNNGQLVVTNVAYTKQAGSRTENVGPENSGEPQKDTSHVLFASFYNEYNVLPTETQLHVTKYVTGSVRPDNNVATFNFRLALLDATTRNGATLPENQTVTITGPGNPGILGTADFDPIKFTQAGTYIFEIDEMTGFETDTQTMPGYTYDGSTWKVSVEVEDHDGTLVVTKKEYNHLVNGERVDSSDVPAEEGARFVNDYDVESAKYAPKVNKEFARSAAARPTEETFTFTLEAAEDYGDDITFSETAAAKEVTVTGAGIASFDDITFNEAGTYEFIISETDSGKAGYTYDPVKWKLTVEVIDTGRQAENVNKSQLLVNTVSYVQIDTDEPKSGAGMATFTNDYQAKEGGYVPQVEKKLTGADRPTEKTFTFSIVENGYTPPAYALALESGLVMPENTEATVTGEGTASFDEIKFTNAGIYSFLITENKGTENGYTYDEAVWNLMVTVEDVAGQLTAMEAVYESNGIEADKATFTNDYQVKTAKYAPQVKKTILGNPLEEEQFNFTLESDEGNDTEGFEFAEGDSGRHVSVNGAGTGSFGGITFKKAGTYTFKVKETSSNSPFWVDDDRTWTVTVVVEDKDGQLVVTSHSYVRDGEDSVTSDTEAEFENEYHGPGDLSIEKSVSGDRGELSRAFNFTVTLTNPQGQPLKGTYEYTGSSSVADVTAPADGTVTNGVLHITLAHGQRVTITGIPSDTKYTVTEAEADADGYTTSVEINGAGQDSDTASGEIVQNTETLVEYLNYRQSTPENPTEPNPENPTEPSPENPTEPSPENPGGNTPGNPGNTTPGRPGNTTPDRPGLSIPEAPVPRTAGIPDIVTISDEPTPLANLENIEDEDVPLAFLAPMTGDNKPVGAVALFGLVALGMMGAFGILAMKKDEEDM